MYFLRWSNPPPLIIPFVRTDNWNHIYIHNSECISVHIYIVPSVSVSYSQFLIFCVIYFTHLKSKNYTWEKKQYILRWVFKLNNWAWGLLIAGRLNDHDFVFPEFLFPVGWHLLVRPTLCPPCFLIPFPEFKHSISRACTPESLFYCQADFLGWWCDGLSTARWCWPPL